MKLNVYVVMMGLLTVSSIQSGNEDVFKTTESGCSKKPDIRPFFSDAWKNYGKPVMTGSILGVITWYALPYLPRCSNLSSTGRGLGAAAVGFLCSYSLLNPGQSPYSKRK